MGLGSRWGVYVLPINLIAAKAFAAVDQAKHWTDRNMLAGLLDPHSIAYQAILGAYEIFLPAIGVAYIIRGIVSMATGKPRGHRNWVLGAAAVSAAMALVFGHFAIDGMVWPLLVYLPFAPLGHEAASLLSSVAFTFILAVAEEVAFRMGLFTGLKKLFDKKLPSRWSLGLATVLSSAVFMTAHFPMHGFGLVGVTVWFTLGALFALMYHRTKSLAVVGTMHATYNLLDGLFMTLFGELGLPELAVVGLLLGVLGWRLTHKAAKPQVSVVVETAGRAAAAETTANGAGRAARKLTAELIARSKKDADDRMRLERRAYSSTSNLIPAFEPLFDRPDSPEGRRLAELYPELAAYAGHAPENASYDHEPAPAQRALIEHVFHRAVGSKLMGLEAGNLALFQRGPGISERAFQHDRVRLRDVALSEFMPRFRAALLFHDIAKGNPSAFADQMSRRDIDLRLSNKASGSLLRMMRYPHSDREGLFENSGAFKPSPILDELAYQLIEMRGLPGQFLRGETTRDVFEPHVRWLREHRAELAAALTPGKPQDLPKLLADIHYTFNVIDTAAVREGLFDDALRARFTAFFASFEAVLSETAPDWSALVAASEPKPSELRVRLAGRLSALRAERIRAGEDEGRILAALDGLSDAEVERLWMLMYRFQGWYVENATSGLSPEAQLKLIALSAALAERKGVDTSKPYHIHFMPMMKNLSSGRGEFDPYKTRLVEALLRPVSLPGVLGGTELERFDLDLHPDAPLGGLSLTVDGDRAISVDFRLSPVAEGLVQLVRFMETKDAVSYHVVLKQLLDLFGVRRDDFDRVANEADYLSGMAAAKTDKSKLVPYAAGTVLEIGPAGGAILLLLEAARRGGAPIHRIVGLDISEEALKDLESIRRRAAADWKLVKGDAFELREALGRSGIGPVDTIVYSSVLHEVYSYVEREGRRFRLDVVRDVLGESLSSLAPGGRLILRDWVAPPDGGKRQRLLIKDRQSRELLEAFRKNFEGRRFEYTVIEDKLSEGGAATVELTRADAMEFLFHLSWCWRGGKYRPDSFPYEVREQYGVLTRDGYLELLQLAAAARGLRISEVPVPEKDRSYLQQGYELNLRPHAELFELDGSPAPYPDDKMLLVVQRG
jgi:membrane protease YdiL (CAAX protease family)/SAM-dependent methyltransferase